MAFVYYDRSGERISKRERDQLIIDEHYGRVSDSVPWRGARLLTFWHGIAPAPFITELFTGDRSNQRWHWGSEEVARTGHEKVLQKILGKGSSLVDRTPAAGQE
jgi:hypothetical protein